MQDIAAKTNTSSRASIQPDLAARVQASNSDYAFHAPSQTIMGGAREQQGLHAETASQTTSASTDHAKTSNGAHSNGHSDMLQKILKDADYRSAFVSKINAVLHAAASLTAFAHGSNSPLGMVNKFFDKAAFAFTKFVAPIISYGLRGVDSLKHKNIIEAFIKFIPPVLMPFIGDANVDVVYGLSTGLNCMHDLAQDSVNNKSKTDANYAAKADQGKKSYRQYALMLLKEAKEICIKFFKGGLDNLTKGTTLASFMIFGGALPIILFARNARDSMFARIVGLFRNIGGIIGDVFFMMDKKDAYKRKTGWLCAVAGLCDIAKRWVGEKWGQIFIHAAAAFNVSGYAAWNARDGHRDIVKA